MYKECKNSCSVIGLVLVFVGLLCGWPVDGVRVHLHPGEEPESGQIYNNKRVLLAHPNYYYLAAAGLLEPSQVNLILREEEEEERRGPSTSYKPASFVFDSGQYLRRQLLVKWFVPYEERTGLHHYDDARDLELAAGPQLDQAQCGLHLDYMVHQVEQHYASLEHSSEFSIFKIMNSFDTPRTGIDLGNNIFPGHYLSCLREKLNVMRHQLDKLNVSASRDYFRRHSMEQRRLSEENRKRFKWWRSVKSFVGPFLGFPRELEPLHHVMAQHSDKLRLVGMRYCLAAIRFPSWPNSSHDTRDIVYRLATCLPEQCDSRSLALYPQQIKRLLDAGMSRFQSASYYIQSLYCLPDEQSKLRSPFTYLSTVLFMCLNCVWLSLIAVATLLHRLDGARKRKSGHRKSVAASSGRTGWRLYLHYFSLIKNTRDFWAARRSRKPQEPLDNPHDNNNNNTSQQQQANKPPASSSTKLSDRHKLNLDPLEGFKVLSSLSVITSHAIVIEFGANWNSIDGEYLISKSWLAMANVICPAIVDNFFVATGIITVLILRSQNKSALLEPLFWLKFLVYRYIRIVPLYLLGHWFLASCFRFLGSGPFWDYGTSHSAWSQVCQQESWWTYILPSANFKSPANHCFGVGWYLANDIQFALITPLIIMLYVKRPLLGHASILAAVSAIMLNHVRYYYLNAQDPRSVFEWSIMGLTRVLDDTSSGYVNPQYRILAYLVGLAAGHLLDSYRQQTSSGWPPAFVRYGKWFLFLTIYQLCAAPFITTLLPLDNEPLIRAVAALMEGLLHGITSIASSVFIMLLVTGHLPVISNFYSLPLFRPFANTALCTLLIHIPLMFYHVQTMRSLPELSFYHCIVTTLIWSLESFLLSIFMHLLYELPLRKLLLAAFKNLFVNGAHEPNAASAPHPELGATTTGAGSKSSAIKSKQQ